MNELYKTVAYEMDAPPDYVNHLKIRTRAIFGETLLNTLRESNNICTCKVVETDDQVDYQHRRYLIRAEVGVVQTHNIVMHVLPDYQAMSWKVLTLSAVDEIKSRVKQIIKKELRKHARKLEK
jgi:hypothetical protein